MGCLLSKDRDLGFAQGRFYAIVDKTSLSHTSGSFAGVKVFKASVKLLMAPGFALNSV